MVLFSAGPGPSTPHPRVLAAASIPMVGHVSPEFVTRIPGARGIGQPGAEHEQAEKF